MISSQKTPVRSAQALFWIGFAVVLSSATGVRSQDVSTGFEFNHLTKEVFTLGDSPKSVTFQGGQATKPFTSELERLVRTGGHSWIIGCKETGKISFETPAAQISFYMYNMGPTMDSRVLMLTENLRVLQVDNGQGNEWVHVEYDGPPIKTVQLENSGDLENNLFPCGGEQGFFPFLAVDDFSFTAFEEPTLEVVDIFYFPLIGDGTAGATQLQTSLFLTSTDADVTVGIEWRDRSGVPLELALGDAPLASDFEVPLDKGQSFAGQSTGTGDLQVGYAIVSVKQPVGDAQSIRSVQTRGNSSSDAGVGGTAVFTRTDNGILMTEAAVPTSRTLTDFTLFLDSIGARDTGLALAIPPPNPIDTRTGPANITVTVWDRAFQTQIATTQFQLNEGEAIGMFIWELFRDFGQVSDEVLDQLRETEGVVTFSMDRPGTAVTLRQNDDSAVDFPNEVPTLVAFPVIPGRADSTN